jgi:hypothetical protein
MLEKGRVFRATIEPDSQDVFLQVQQFRTLPYVVRLLFTVACDGCDREGNSSDTDMSRLAVIGGKGLLFAGFDF